MDIYIYDGTKEGFYTAIFDAYQKNRDKDTVITARDVQYKLGCEVDFIATDPQKYRRIESYLQKNAGNEVVRHINAAYLSGKPDKDTVIYRFFRLLFQKGGSAAEMHNLQPVADFFILSRAVLHESHLMCGFIRFSKLSSGIYYAAYSPDNDVTELIVPHFKARYSDQPFIIHDTARSIAALYNGKRHVVVPCPKNLPAGDVSGEERLFCGMWKTYFNAISIIGRKNKRLQNRCMPVRYRKFMVETHQNPATTDVERDV